MSDLDPRPDLETDHPAWVRVLTRAAVRDDQLFLLLSGLRGYGARLVEQRTMYRLAPRFEPDGGWVSQSEWDHDARRFLEPAKDMLKEVLAV